MDPAATRCARQQACAAPGVLPRGRLATERIANFAAFQACWFACVLGAARGWEWLGPALALAWAAWHARSCGRGEREVAALALVTVLGTALDSLQIALGWIDYSGWAPLGWLAPPWISALWLAFATTFESSFAWATRRAWLMALLGALGAPLSYLAGERLGALQLLEPRAASLIGCGVAWGLALPLAAGLYARVLHGRAAR